MHANREVQEKLGKTINYQDSYGPKIVNSCRPHRNKSPACRLATHVLQYLGMFKARLYNIIMHLVSRRNNYSLYCIL